MDIQDWQIIKRLHKYKTITQTAQSMYLSQPALTARIKRIEHFFNTSLIVRHRRGVQFTSEGEYLAKWANKLLKQYEFIQDNLNDMKNEVTGVLKIGVSKYLAKYKMPTILSEFKQKYPKIEFQVLTGWSGDVYKLVLNRDVHVGFVRGDYPWQEGKDLLIEESICAAYTEPFEWDDLPHLPLIDYETDYRIRQTIENWWTEHYKKPPYTSIEVDQVDTCKEMIIKGLGYGILPSIIMEDYKNIYKKVLVDPEGDPLIRKTWLYYYTDSLDIGMVNRFIAYVRNTNIINS